MFKWLAGFQSNCSVGIGGARATDLTSPSAFVDILRVAVLQAQLKKGTVAALKQAVPALTDAQAHCLRTCGAFMIVNLHSHPHWPDNRPHSAADACVPAQLEKMQLIPTRSFDPNIIQASVLEPGLPILWVLSSMMCTMHSLHSGRFFPGPAISRKFYRVACEHASQVVVQTFSMRPITLHAAE